MLAGEQGMTGVKMSMKHSSVTFPPLMSVHHVAEDTTENTIFFCTKLLRWYEVVVRIIFVSVQRDYEK